MIGTGTAQSANLLLVGQLIRHGNTASFIDDGCEKFNEKNTLVANVLVIEVYKVNTPTYLIALRVIK